MRVSKCKWKDGKSAPVLLMIDDFANKCMLRKKNGNYIGADWGARCYQKNSFLSILNDKLLKKFPYIKITLFLVTGKRESIIKDGIKSYSEQVDKNENFIYVLKELSKNSSFEIAYHGLTHGKIINGVFVQEWKTFQNLEDAKNTIIKGKEIVEGIINKKLKGGKYCGYATNNFSDQSIKETGFTWWCRHWEGGVLFTDSSKSELSFEMNKFGNVVDIPSTLNGTIFSLKNFKGLFNKGYLRGLYYKLKKGITLEKMIDFLVENQYVISIQEHSSPEREDGKVQTPNIISDMPNLIYIFNYLKKYDLWYATATEIADYYNLYCSVNLESGADFIKVYCDKEYNGQLISIEINDIECNSIELWNAKENIVMNRKKSVFVGEVMAMHTGHLYYVRRN